MGQRRTLFGHRGKPSAIIGAVLLLATGFFFVASGTAGAQAGCVDDGLNNGDFANPADLFFGGQVSGIACPGLPDYYTIAAVAGEQIEVEALFSHAEGDVDILLFDPTGVVVDFSTSITDNELISFPANISGDWTLEVFLFGEGRAEYDVAVISPCQSEFNGFETIPDERVRSAFEPGPNGPFDTIPTSNRPQASVVCPGQVHEYQVWAVPGELVQAEVFFRHAFGDIDIVLRDPAGVVRDTGSSITDNEIVSAIADQEGRWIIEVFAFDQRPNFYTFNLDSPCSEDLNEPNNTRAEAMPVDPSFELEPGLLVDGGTSCGGVNEDDWFSFDVEAGEAVFLSLFLQSSANAGEDLDLRVFDDQGNLVAEALGGARETSSVSAIADRTGTWFLQVRAVNVVDSEYFFTVRTDQPSFCNGELVTVDLAQGHFTTAGDDVILGTDGPDVINAGDGNDLICAGGGDDIINAGNGADIVFGGDGDDQIQLGQGRDSANAGSGDDFVSGGRGKDTINGGAGNDDLRGNEGTDTINGGNGNDLLRGGQKADVISGGGGDDELVGGTRPDFLDGGAGLDRYNGGAGSDICTSDPNGLVEVTQACES